MEILRPGYPASDSVFAGDDDELTIHAGAFDERGRLVSVASMFLESRPAHAPGPGDPADDHRAGTAWRLRGMATAPDARGTGAGSAALELCLGHVRNHGGTLAWCNARTPALGFYERLGWHVLGEEFEIPTVGPHFVMERRMS